LHPAWLLLCMAGWACAAPPPAQWLLTNPYPATGALDIAGSNPASRASRAMQTYATPSPVDIVARQLQQTLAHGLNETVDLDRNPRGGGDDAADDLVQAPATARVLLLAGSGLGGERVLQVLRTLQPIAMLARAPVVLVTHSGGDAEKGGTARMADLLQKAKRGRIPTAVGTPGERSVGHAIAGLLHVQWPQGVAPVAFNGGNGALRGIISTQVAASLVPLPTVMPFAADPRIRILATTTAARLPALPAVPTLRESGIAVAEPGGWYGLFAPARLPTVQLQRLVVALEPGWRNATTRQTLLAPGFMPDHQDATALRRLVNNPPETAVSAPTPPVASPR
jgi:tripartite-type tricarboxylate transporter receptor subunit TctC